MCNITLAFTTFNRWPPDRTLIILIDTILVIEITTFAAMQLCPHVIFRIKLFQFFSLDHIFGHINAICIFHRQYKDRIFAAETRSFFEPIQRFVCICIAVQPHFVNHGNRIIGIHYTMCCRTHEQFKAFILIFLCSQTVKIHQAKDIFSIAIAMICCFFQPVQSFF